MSHIIQYLIQALRRRLGLPRTRFAGPFGEYMA